MSSSDSSQKSRKEGFASTTPTWVSIRIPEPPERRDNVNDFPASISSEFHSGVRFADDLVKVFDNLHFDSDDSFDNIDVDFEDFDDDSCGYEVPGVWSAESTDFQVEGL